MLLSYIIRTGIHHYG